MLNGKQTKSLFELLRLCINFRKAANNLLLTVGKADNV
jgi:hypothetical protein